MSPSRSRRIGAWLARWDRVLPLLIAEGTVWIGFGAMLPILPIYFTEHGVDLPTLGLVVAAWPAARLVSEPVAGWVADRSARKPLMIAGLLVAGVASVLPLALVGPLAFLVLRAVAGVATAVYDPAARGYLVDGVPAERQGEAFGLYSAVQMGGLVLGPAVGGLAAAAADDPTVVFWVAGVSLVVAAVLVAVRVPELAGSRHASRRDERAAPDASAAAADGPGRLLNRLLVAAVVLNVGSFFASGVYEVVWSLYLTDLGASLAVIGVSFACFGIPILVLSPFAGRLIDRRGGFALLVGGLVGAGVAGIVYTFVPEVWWVLVVALFEGTAFALAGPALYTLVARGTPPGRSSTAQGIFGAAGTTGTIVASLAAGILADVDLRLPFVVGGVAILAITAVGLAGGGSPLVRTMRARAARAPAAGQLGGLAADPALEP